MGTDYFADPRGRLIGLKDKNGQISSGWASLDSKTFGGFNRGELNIFAGGCVVADTEVEIVNLFRIEDIIANRV